MLSKFSKGLSEFLKRVPFVNSAAAGGGAEGELGGVLARGAGGAFFVDICGLAVALVAQVVLVRVMGSVEFGRYIYVLAWLQVGAVVAKLGYDFTVVRFLPGYAAEQQWGLFRGLLLRSRVVSFGAACVVGVLGAGVVYALGSVLERELAALFAIACLILPLVTLEGVHEGILRALRQAVRYRLPEAIVRPAMVLLLAVCWYHWFGEQLGASMVMMFVIAALLFCLLLTTRWLKRLVPSEVRSARRQYRHKEWFSYSFSMAIVSVMNILRNKTDILLIGFFLGTTSAGIYAVASAIAAITILALNAANIICAPLIAELHQKKAHEQLQRILKLAARGIFWLSVPTALLFVVFGRDLLALFDPTFSAGYWALVILVAGQLINALSGSVGHVLFMTGHQKLSSKLTTLSVLLNIVLNLVLIPPWGLVGAALATAAALAAVNVFSVLYVWRVLKLRTTVFF